MPVLKIPHFNFGGHLILFYTTVFLIYFAFGHYYRIQYYLNWFYAICAILLGGLVLLNLATGLIFFLTFLAMVLGFLSGCFPSYLQALAKASLSLLRL